MRLLMREPLFQSFIEDLMEEPENRGTLSATVDWMMEQKVTLEEILLPYIKYPSFPKDLLACYDEFLQTGLFSTRQWSPFLGKKPKRYHIAKALRVEYKPAMTDKDNTTPWRVSASIKGVYPTFFPKKEQALRQMKLLVIMQYAKEMLTCPRCSGLGYMNRAINDPITCPLCLRAGKVRCDICSYSWNQV